MLFVHLAMTSKRALSKVAIALKSDKARKPSELILYDTLVRLRILHLFLPSCVCFGEGMAVSSHVWNDFSRAIFFPDKEHCVSDSLNIEAKLPILSTHVS